MSWILIVYFDGDNISLNLISSDFWRTHHIEHVEFFEAQQTPASGHVKLGEEAVHLDVFLQRLNTKV